MQAYFFTCPMCERLTDRAGAFFNEGKPFCSDECRTADFQSRNMIYIELPDVQPGSFPDTQQQLGERDGDWLEAPNDLAHRVQRGGQYE